MVATLDGLRAQHPKGVFAVVSHADIIKLAIAYYVGMHMDLFQRLEISPCSVSAIFFTPMGPRLLAYNDTGSLEHLKPKPPEQPQEAAQAQPAEPAPAAAEQATEPAAEPALAAAEELAAPSTNGVEEPAAPA
jgi:probable phosphoglycerate mutase